ncbi:MAG: hypothetical protein NC181_00490 [Clostridium sp.]|nr:hypothetical protein [Clostridium sp.]MCM1443857.1 hypothetical protein [Candidatus Amulumruptor caecigallinarius]
MKIKTGYIYHIKDEFFDKINNKSLMINHENGHARPTYFTIKDKDILWFIPLSSKISKYQPIIDKKIKKYGDCKSILIEAIGGKKQVILIQNAFPTLEKYIDHPHIVDGKPLKVIDSLKDEILTNFKYLISMKNHGNNLFFTDIDKIKEQMLEEINN